MREKVKDENIEELVSSDTIMYKWHFSRGCDNSIARLYLFGYHRSNLFCGQKYFDSKYIG